MTHKRILRLRRLSHPDSVRVVRPIVSIEHGYLWIGGQDGGFCCAIAGKKTLHALAAMLKRYAR